MREYIKIIILAVFTGVMKPLPVSSSAQFALLNKALSFSENSSELGFYYSIFSICFSVCVFVMLRKIYIKSIKALFITNKEKLKKEKLPAYKKVATKILLSFIPVAVLVIPISEGTFLLDYFDKFLTENGLFLVAFACIINALVMVISIWYTRQNFAPVKRLPDTKSVVRMAVYSVVSYVVPGFSQFSGATTNMLITDSDERVIMRDSYLYLAPQIFVVSLIKIVKYIIEDLVFDPVMVLTGIIASSVVSFAIIYFVGKFNMRKMFAYFCVYSAVLGFAIGVTMFFA